MRWPSFTSGPRAWAVEIPVLVLVGEHDEATPPPMSHELAAGLPHALSRLLQAAAHVRNCNPEMFLDTIGDFLPGVVLRADLSGGRRPEHIPAHKTLRF